MKEGRIRPSLRVSHKNLPLRHICLNEGGSNSTLVVAHACNDSTSGDRLNEGGSNSTLVAARSGNHDPAVDAASMKEGRIRPSLDVVELDGQSSVPASMKEGRIRPSLARDRRVSGGVCVPQ